MSLARSTAENSKDEARKEALRVDFDSQIKLECHSAAILPAPQVTTHAIANTDGSTSYALVAELGLAQCELVTVENAQFAITGFE